MPESLNRSNIYVWDIEPLEKTSTRCRLQVVTKRPLRTDLFLTDLEMLGGGAKSAAN